MIWLPTDLIDMNVQPYVNMLKRKQIVRLRSWIYMYIQFLSFYNSDIRESKLHVWYFYCVFLSCNSFYKAVELICQGSQVLENSSD